MSVSWPNPVAMFKGTVSDRFSIIAQYIQPPKSVMDLGCVDSRPARLNTTDRIEYKVNLLHKRIAEVNKEVLGVDTDAVGVSVLNKQGFNVIVGDAETMDVLPRKFDTIIAGEVIEHLENPGQFLRNMKRHLKSDGIIILSTPNPFYQGASWKIWRYGKPSVHEDHMNWQDPATLKQLLCRTGFEPFEGYWVQPNRVFLKTWKRLFRPYFSQTFMWLARPKN